MNIEPVLWAIIAWASGTLVGALLAVFFREKIFDFFDCIYYRVRRLLRLKD